MPAVDLED